MNKGKAFITTLILFLTLTSFSLSANNNAQRGGFIGDMMSPMTDFVKAITTPMTEMFDKSMDTMLELSDDIGSMADRILTMADKIGDMADRINQMADRMAELTTDLANSGGSNNCNNTNSNNNSNTGVALLSPEENANLSANEAPEINFTDNTATRYLLIASNLQNFPQGETVSIIVKNQENLNNAWNRIVDMSRNNSIYLAVRTIKSDYSLSSISNSVKVFIQ